MKTLSEKNKCLINGYPLGTNVYTEKDFKQFIKDLKEKIEWTQTKGEKLGMITEQQIDKLLGDKLI